MHLLVAAGNLDEWANAGSAAWVAKINDWIEPLKPVVESPSLIGPVSSLSVYPYSGEFDSQQTQHMKQQFCSALGCGVTGTNELECLKSGVRVRINICPDGQWRLAQVAQDLCDKNRRKRITEVMIDEALFGDAGEPDLVVACGKATRSIPSLVWELAYSEIVYVDVDWKQLGASHLDSAIRDFHNRNRRFGGV